VVPVSSFTTCDGAAQLIDNVKTIEVRIKFFIIKFLIVADLIGFPL
jgi:hypothetical protein